MPYQVKGYEFLTKTLDVIKRTPSCNRIILDTNKPGKFHFLPFFHCHLLYDSGGILSVQWTKHLPLPLPMHTSKQENKEAKPFNWPATNWSLKVCPAKVKDNHFIFQCFWHVHNNLTTAFMALLSATLQPGKKGCERYLVTGRRVTDRREDDASFSPGVWGARTSLILASPNRFCHQIAIGLAMAIVE